jgi:hypothetical protein
MDSEKQQQSPGPSFVPDPKKPLYLQRIAKESNLGRDEFSRIAEDENKRAQQIAEKENQRIMQEMRENGTIQICPLCLDEIPALQSHEERKQRKRGAGIRMLCCGATHCNNCKDKCLNFMIGKSGNDMTKLKCFNCREPMRDPMYWAKEIKPNDKRYWLLHAVAGECMAGINGLKKDIKKAIKLYERAAELGDAASQDILALHYYNSYRDSGKSKKCLEKMRYYAEKAAHQGIINSQYILADLFMNSDCNRNEEILRLLTLAAFQGHHRARSDLAWCYERMFQCLPSRDAAWKKNLLLSVYWYGKGAEVEKQNHPKGCKSLPNMVLHLDLAMRSLWHPRNDGNIRSPLPGYSHVPFCTWALAKGGQNTPLIFSKPLFDCWKNRCANCDRMSECKQNFKACARCKAFHYCSKKCQVQHWKAGHKVDCKGHWIEEFFPDIRKPILLT